MFRYIKNENIIYGNASDINHYLIYVGSKTGNEGINGANIFQILLRIVK